MCPQLLLRISTPRDKPPLYASQFRELLAREARSSPFLTEAFFHYLGGQPIRDAEPDIRTVGGKHWVGILSKSGTNPLFDVAVGLAGRLVSEHFGQPAPLSVEQLDYRFERGMPRAHVVRDLAVRIPMLDRRPQRQERSLSPIRNSWKRDASDEDLVANAVRRMFERAAAGGMDVPTTEGLDVQVVECKSLGLRLNAMGIDTSQSVKLINATIILAGRCHGIWQAGNLQARGYGRIIPVDALGGDLSEPTRRGRGVLK